MKSVLLILILFFPYPSFAARQFNGTDQAMQAASVDLSDTQAATISLWLQVTATPGADDIVFEFGASVITVSGSIVFGINNGGVNQLSVYTRTDVGPHGALYPAINQGEYHHYAIIGDISQTTNEVDLYIDGVLQTPDSRDNANNNTGNLSTLTLNFMSRNNTTLFSIGDLADVAVWNMRLSGTDISSLAGGALPNTIQAANLRGYWKLCGDESPEPDSSSANHDATLFNAPTQVAHPSQIPSSCAAPSSRRRLTVFGVGP